MAKKKSNSPKKKIIADGSIHKLPISMLHLDHQNPRFGVQDEQIEESSVLDEIESQHGVDGVISSIARNGYFEAEPLIGAINKGHGSEITIVEGNRRLTACLILLNDPRAARQQKLREKFPEPAITAKELPVVVYDWKNEDHRKRLLPYLGVRHIVGISDWDSFAKAAWVKEMLDTSSMELGEIKAVIGDESGFTDRIVEGFNVVEQVRKSNLYAAESSLRKGRGSLQAFPFSWVYTALGYKNVRNYLGLPSKQVIEECPIKDSYGDQVGNLFQFMFGGKGRNAAIDDSRQIGQLSAALDDDRSIEVLLAGGTAADALEALASEGEQIEKLLNRTIRSLSSASDVASGVDQVARNVWVNLDEKILEIFTRTERLSEVIDDLKPSAKRKTKRRNK